MQCDAGCPKHTAGWPGRTSRTATVAAPGGPFTRIALESPSFIPLVKARTASRFAYESTLFNNFFHEARTLIDSGDPINHICNCTSAKPLHLIKGNGDTVVPNSTTDNIIRDASFTKLRSGVSAVAPDQPVYVAFTKGSTVRCSAPRRARPPLQKCSRCCSPPRRRSRAGRS